MPYGGKHNFHDKRTGRFRKASHHEKNRHFRIDTLTRGIANFAFKTSNEMGDIASDFATELVEYAQANAPWTDQSGDARAGLVAEVTLENDSLEIDLMHTVSYGIWLEVRWGAKYAIIIPTIETMGPKLLAKMDGMLGEIWYP